MSPRRYAHEEGCTICGGAVQTCHWDHPLGVKSVAFSCPEHEGLVEGLRFTDGDLKGVLSPSVVELAARDYFVAKQSRT